MFTLSHYQQKAHEILVPLYGEREASAVVKLWFETRLQMTRIDLVMRREEEVDFPSFEADLAQLKEKTPVQLVLRRSLFLRSILCR